MKRVLLSAVTVVLVLAALPSFATAAENLKEVIVRNTDAQPVPTKAIGTTTVSGGVAVTNTPTVNVGNTPSVRVADPVEVTGAVAQAPRGEPFQMTDLVVIGDGKRSDLGEVFLVPAGKDLVVTFITVRARNFSGVPGRGGAPLDVNVTSAEGPGIQVFVPMHRAGDADSWSGSTMTDVTFPRQMIFDATRTTSADTLQFNYTIAGYLVDEPAP